MDLDLEEIGLMLVNSQKCIPYITFITLIITFIYILL